jgi:phospholipid/cholesterol/gamma-HCH transport system ATP-binding protein
MFQGGALLNSLSIAENVALPIRHHTKLDEDTIATMVKMKLHQVDLLHAADRRPSAISGGMQKRAAVARALALDPKILFYDEPSAGLDPIATTRIDQLINRLKTTMRMTNVIVTHVMESVQRIADRIIMLDRGKVILDGSLHDLMSSDDPLIRQFRTGDLTGPGGGVTSVEDYVKDLLM